MKSSSARQIVVLLAMGLSASAFSASSKTTINLVCAVNRMVDADGRSHSRSDTKHIRVVFDEEGVAEITSSDGTELGGIGLPGKVTDDAITLSTSVQLSGSKFGRSMRVERWSGSFRESYYRNDIAYASYYGICRVAAHRAI